jgi:hypothetical protein
MKSNRELNRLMASLLNVAQTYEIRRELRVMYDGLTLEEANTIMSTPKYNEQRNIYTITSSVPFDYCSDLNLSLTAAKRLSEENEKTFVLALEDGEWKASFGDWRDCCESKGSNPSYCVCVAILKYMGRL